MELIHHPFSQEEQEEEGIHLNGSLKNRHQANRANHKESSSNMEDELREA